MEISNIYILLKTKNRINFFKDIETNELYWNKKLECYVYAFSINEKGKKTQMISHIQKYNFNTISPAMLIKVFDFIFNNYNTETMKYRFQMLQHCVSTDFNPYEDELEIQIGYK